MTGVSEDPSGSSKDGRTRSDSLALVSPSSSWQDSLQRLLLPRASATAFSHNDTATEMTGTSTPDPRARRASFPLMSNNVTFPAKAPSISPMVSLSSLASFPSENGSERVGWENLEGLERIDSESADSEDLEVRMPPKIDDVYVDQDGQLRMASRISGLQLLHQCQSILTGRREGHFEYPWRSGTPGAGVNAAATSLCATPTEQQQRSMIQLYSEYVHPMFPIVSRSTFATLYSQNFRSRSANLYVTFIPSLYYPDVGAPQIQFTDDPTRSFVKLYYCLGITALAWICLAADIDNALGMAVRMAEALGIHRTAEELAPSGHGVLTIEDQQMRQQIWSGCLVADRYMAVLLGRPSAIQLSAFDVAPVDISQSREEGVFYSPLHVDHRVQLGNESTALLCFNASRSLSCIIGSVMDELYPITQPPKSHLERRAKHLEYRLSQWRQLLPSALLFDQSRIGVLPPPCVLELHLQYWRTVILLHRALGFYSGPDSMQSKALATCRDAAGQISSMFSSAFVPGYLLCVGVVDVLTLTILHHDEAASARLRSTLAALQRIETTWPMACVVRSSLDRAMSNTASASIDTLRSPMTLRHKRSAREVFADDETVGGAKKMSDRQSPTSDYMKNPENGFDTLGRMVGLDTGLGFITSQPYSGYLYRGPQLGSSAVSSFPGMTYSPDSFSTVAPPATSFGLCLDARRIERITFCSPDWPVAPNNDLFNHYYGGTASIIGYLIFAALVLRLCLQPGDAMTLPLQYRLVSSGDLPYSFVAFVSLVSWPVEVLLQMDMGFPTWVSLLKSCTALEWYYLQYVYCLSAIVFF
ncbi:hypothetical protein IEO21_02088 [Rhodonia placenta]|uniref:Xylanolytic transcriptional activator regulatory domain-containing protein n=1 Tax=Rhodonia placenta TaxID=104341 RepID=A0A8H7P8M8_9APHY|nr:hypothetical protein IEO21_02088 [Postia placenta]